MFSSGEPPWNEVIDGDCVLDSYAAYENNGSITAKVFPDGEEGGALGDMIAAFVGEEQRGVGCAAEVPVFLGNGFAFLTMVYSNATSGETLTFQYYDESGADAVYNTDETIEFISNMVEGDVTEPFVLTYSPGSGPSDTPGCTDESACNYDSGATSDDGSCEYAAENFDCDGNCLVGVDCADECGGSAVEDCAGECGGSAVVDECGECGGDGIDEGACDCAGNVLDCADECGGSAAIDECGECGGSGYADECDVCDDDPSNDCEQDCNDVWGGDAVADNCGTCDNDPSNDCSLDCNGDIWW